MEWKSREVESLCIMGCNDGKRVPMQNGNQLDGSRRGRVSQKITTFVVRFLSSKPEIVFWGPQFPAIFMAFNVFLPSRLAAYG